MIQSYRDKRTKEFAVGKRVKEFEGFRRQAEKRLDILDAATSLPDLQALPSNALEAMKGDRKGQYSIRINMQWRIASPSATSWVTVAKASLPSIPVFGSIAVPGGGIEPERRGCKQC